MREPIYRIWDKQLKTYAVTFGIMQEVTSPFSLEEIFKSKSSVIEAFIGAADNWGEMIFEGDIVSFQVENQNMWVGPRIGEIKFNEEILSFVIFLNENAFLPIGTYLGAFTNTIKILGNIHQNAELLEQYSNEKHEADN